MPAPIRYIKNGINGYVSGDAATRSYNNKWVELKAIEIDSAGNEINRAAGRTATTSTGTITYASNLTNGSIVSTGNLTTITNGTAAVELIIDLGAIYDIDYIHLWHDYSTTNRKYVNNFLYVSTNNITWYVLQKSDSITVEIPEGYKYWIKLNSINIDSKIEIVNTQRELPKKVDSINVKRNFADSTPAGITVVPGQKITKSFFLELQDSIDDNLNINWTQTPNDNYGRIESIDYNEFIDGTNAAMNSLNCNNNCVASCSTNCVGSCTGSCGNNCGGSSCIHSCGSSTCSHNCGSGCSSTCGSGCYHNCGSGCSSTCGSGCQGGCAAQCSGSSCTDGCDNNCSSKWTWNTDCVDYTCRDNCTRGCDHNCGSGCSYTCGSGCHGGCAAACAGGCAAACRGGCAAACRGGCVSTCNSGCRGTCSIYCTTSCIGSCITSCTNTCINSAGSI